MKKEFNNNGKGKRPIIGYNAKKWYANFDEIRWDKKSAIHGSTQWCAWCGKWCDHTSGSCEDLKKQTKKD